MDIGPPRPSHKNSEPMFLFDYLDNFPLKIRVIPPDQKLYLHLTLDKCLALTTYLLSKKNYLHALHGSM